MYWFEPSPFFSWRVWLKVYQFYVFREPDFSFIDLFYYFLHLFYFCCDLYDFFPSTTLGFVCSFSSWFICKVRLLEVLLISWGKLVLLWTSLLEMLLLCPIGFGSSCFHFHVSRYFWFPFLQWFIGCLVAYYLSNTCLFFLVFFFTFFFLCSWFLTTLVCGQKKWLILFQVS